MATNEEKALAAKNKGNAEFQAGNFEQAIAHFTEAIGFEPDNHVLYSNRSGAYASNKQYQQAKEDALKTIQLKPDWPKGYSRLGYAQFQLGEYQECLQTYSNGLKIDPNNPQLLQGLEDVKAVVKPIGLDALSGLFSGDIWTTIALDPKLRPYSHQPDFVSIVNEIKANPQSLSKHLKDPRVQQLLSTLLSRFTGGADPMGEAESGGGGSSWEKYQEEKKKREEEEERRKEEAKAAAAKQAKEEAEAKAKAEYDALSPDQKRAAALKEEANALYKRKELDQALAIYREALALDPKNYTIKLNISAALFEKGDYAGCVSAAQEVLALREEDVRLPPATIAKTYYRMGNAYLKMKDYAKAVEAYSKATVEVRDPVYVKALDQAQRLKKQKDDEDYINPEISLEEKEKGNALFKDGHFPEAIKHYTEAIKRNPKDHVLYSNRAACYLKLSECNLVIKDCDTCLSLKPDFVKAYVRKGNAQLLLKQYGAALETFEAGLKIDPSDPGLLEGENMVVAAIQRSQPDPEAAARDPEIQAILSDPVMRQILNDMASNPECAREHMKNPQIASKIFKLKAAGIIG